MVMSASAIRNGPTAISLPARSVRRIVDVDDIIEFNLDGTPVDPNEKRPLYLERFIHGGVYEKRPDVKAALHSHADDLLPFSISKTTRLKPVIHAVGDMGDEVPVWDIADKFGDDTTLLVTNMAQGRDLAGCLGCYRLALMRGHGFVCVGFSINDLVRLSVYIPRNARTQLAAMQMGEYKALSRGEIEARLKLDSGVAGHAPWLGILGARSRLRASAIAQRRRRRFRSINLFECNRSYHVGCHARPGLYHRRCRAEQGAGDEHQSHDGRGA